jgi:hypothetical protein
MNKFHGWPHRSAEGDVSHGRRGLLFVTVGVALAVAGIGVVRLVTPARAAAASLPRAEVLIQKMIDATGGKAAYDGMKSRFLAGKMSLPKSGIEMTYTSWAERPNKSYVLMESPALGKMESGCDGATVWENSSMAGPNVKKGAERAMQLREADFDRWTNWKKYYESATTAGADTVSGHAAWMVQMVPREGTPELMWFDQATGLLLKASVKVQTEMGEVPFEVLHEDYREVCGTKIAFRTRQVMMGGAQEMVSTTDSVVCNPTIPKDRFALPAEVKAVLEKAKTEGKAAKKGEGKKE